MRKNSSLRTREIEPLEEPLINLTPLIDVVFVILISFMLLAPLLDIESVDLALSSLSSEKEQTPQHPFSVSIQKDGSFWVKGEKLELAAMKSLLLTEKRAHPDLTPQLAPDRQAPFGAYQEAKNVFEECGFSQMEVLLRPR